MDDKEIRKVQRRVRIAILSMKIGSLVDHEDAQQEIICQMLNGHHSHATISQAVIDYLRRELGRPSPTKMSRVDMPAVIADPVDRHSRAEMQMDLVRLFKDLTERELQVTVNYFFDGYTLEEIGKRIGTCDSRVSQILTSSKNKMKQAARFQAIMR